MQAFVCGKSFRDALDFGSLALMLVAVNESGQHTQGQNRLDLLFGHLIGLG